MSKHISKILEEGIENLSEDQLQELASEIEVEDFLGLDEEIQEAIKLLMSEEKIQEVTAAADTLKPQGAPGQSKAEMLSTFTDLMSQLGKEDLSKWMNDAIAQSKKGADGVPSGNAAKNKQSVAMKENVEEMFSGEDNLSEEFKDRATTILEAVVNTEIIKEQTRLQEEYEAAEQELKEAFDESLQEQANEIFESVTDSLNSYLDHIVESWLDENEVAIESTVRTELAESFISGLHNLFAENYVNVPDEEVDVIGEMKAQIDYLTDKLNEVSDEKIRLESFVSEANKNSILDEISEGLAETEVEKLRSLSEGIEYIDEDSYANKLNILKEAFFKSSNGQKQTGLITEEIDGTDTESLDEGHQVDGDMLKYVQAISKTIK